MAQRAAMRKTVAARRAKRPGLSPVIVVGTAAGLLIATGIAASSGLSVSAALGLPDSGPLTSYGIPVVRVVADIAAALTVGFLLLAAVLVPPQASGYLDVAGYRSVRTASICAAVWAGAALLLVPLTVSEAIGRPVQAVLAPAPLVAAIPLLPTSGAWVVTAGVAFLVAAGARVALTWGSCVVLLGVAVAGLLPVATSGHSAVGGSHDIATDSLMLHVAAAALWVGGLVAVLALALSPSSDRLRTALPRFSVLASWCWVLMAVSGVVNLAVRVPLGVDTLLSAYGVLAGAKVGALVLLGVIGWAHRRRTIAPAVRGDRRALLRLGGAEVILMLATIGLAVGLGRTPPPSAESAAPTRTGEVLGYELTRAPGADMLFDVRLDLVFALLVAVLLAGYGGGVRRVRARGGAWPWWRTAAWVSGCVAIVMATSSGIGRYGAAMLSVSMASQVLLVVVAPVLLVAAAPLGLARAALPREDPRGGPSPRGSLNWVLARPFVRVVRRPAPAVALFVGGQAALQLFGWLGLLLSTQAGRLFLDAFLLLSGCLLAAALMGSTRPPSPATRWGLAAAVVVGSVGAGAAMLIRPSPIAEEYYRSLALPWVPDLLVEQSAAGVVWLVGQLALLPLLIVWLRVGNADTDSRPPAVAISAGGNR
ncbi:MAG: bifunctional copper resistance protein CopD/cytochrome c oxidase assembly protein [Pseudonocardia sp.]|nr:bifunctional copper resistance protein CopD/cytochrome c oxidase assembly protein [Pseudonocardia sp.]